MTLNTGPKKAGLAVVVENVNLQQDIISESELLLWALLGLLRLHLVIMNAKSHDLKVLFTNSYYWRSLSLRPLRHAALGRDVEATPNTSHTNYIGFSNCLESHHRNICV